MKYRNYGPYKKDPISRALQFQIDYSYMRSHSPECITGAAKLLNMLINLGWLLLLYVILWLAYK